MAINQPFTTASQALVNYNSTDIENGTGYQDYYFCRTEDNSGANYILTPNQDYTSGTSYIRLSAAGTSDQDFDLTPFVLPRRIKGTCLVSIPVVANGGGHIATFIVEVYKWNGTSETKISDTITYAVTLVSGVPQMLLLTPTISETIIPVGEQLRVRISFSIPGAIQTQYGIDPAGRTDATLTITTTSKISIPYALDI